MTIATSTPISSSATAANAAAEQTVHPSKPSSSWLARAWRWLRGVTVGGAGDRRLRVADTVSLGEKRFVAVVQVDGRHFLLAGGPANIALLAQLNEQDDFGDVLKRTMTPPAAAQQLPQAQEQPTRKRAARPKKAPAPIWVAPPKQAKAAAQSKKVTSAGMKKQPALAAKRSSKPVATQSRFGDIPPTTGARAFEKWLGRAVPIAATHPSTVKVDAPPPEKANAPVPLPVKPNPTPTPTLDEWLKEARPVPEKQPVQPVTEPVNQPSVEEYA